MCAGVSSPEILRLNRLHLLSVGKTTASSSKALSRIGKICPIPYRDLLPHKKSVFIYAQMIDPQIIKKTSKSGILVVRHLKERADLSREYLEVFHVYSTAADYSW